MADAITEICEAFGPAFKKTTAEIRTARSLTGVHQDTRAYVRLRLDTRHPAPPDQDEIASMIANVAATLTGDAGCMVAAEPSVFRVYGSDGRKVGHAQQVGSGVWSVSVECCEAFSV